MGEPEVSEVSVAPSADAFDRWASDLRGFLGLDSGAAEAAVGKVPPELQDALLSRVEARLAEEVRRLVGSLDQFSRRAQLIGELLPNDADFRKAVTGFLSLLCLQFAHSLRKGLDKPIFLDDGAEYLRELNLSLNDLVREISLDGRRFLAVALVEQGSSEILGDAEGRSE